MGCFAYVEKYSLTVPLLVFIMQLFISSLYWIIGWTRGEGGRRAPSPLVWVAGTTLISSEEVVLSEFVHLSA